MVAKKKAVKKSSKTSKTRSVKGNVKKKAPKKPLKKSIKKVAKKKSVKKVVKKPVKKVKKKVTSKKAVKAVKAVKAQKPRKPGVELIKVNGEEIEYVPPKSFKVLGYCPDCYLAIGEGDLESKMIFVCPSCSCRKRTKYLKENSKREDKVKVSSKEEYLKAARDIKVEPVEAVVESEDEVVVDAVVKEVKEDD